MTDSFHSRVTTAIFRAYDIRGDLKQLTPSVVARIGQGFAQFYQHAQQQQIVIGYDARLSSPHYARIVQQCLTDAGFETILIGQCSTPMLYCIAKQYQGNGIMVTASHNPKHDNGFKWLLRSQPPTPEMIQNIGQLAQQASVPHWLNDCAVATVETFPQYHARYYRDLMQHLNIGRQFKLVIDGLHGSAGAHAQHVLVADGHQVHALRCEANGHFPEHAPDPSKAAHLHTLCHTVVAEQADLGIALDGDGDRLVLVDANGQVISADQLMCLFAQMCLEQHPQHEFVFDVKCSSIVAQTVRAYGGIPVMLRTGSSFLRQYLAQSQGRAIFGGEYAGHYVFNDAHAPKDDDGLYAALRVLAYLSQTGKTLAQALQPYPKRIQTADMYIDTHQVNAQELLAEIAQMSQQLDAQLTQIDGVRLDFADGFGIIRASNTGEYFTVRFDADSRTRLQQIRQYFVDLLQPKYPHIAQQILDAH